MRRLESARESAVGVTRTKLAVERELGWVFREQPTDDFGIDAQVEIVQAEAVSGKLLGVQIKSGLSWFDEPGEGGWWYRPDANHVSYWTNHSLPVVVVLCHPETERCHWQLVSQETLIATSRGGYKLLVPEAQVLDDSARGQLLRAAARDPVGAARLSAGSTIVVGNIPAEPRSFLSREGMLAVLDDRGHPRAGSGIHVLWGMRGTGKTQAAAAYARHCIADKWRLVAWVYAGDGPVLLDGLGRVAAAVGVGVSVPGDDQASAARALRHWLEVNGDRCLLVLDDADDPDELRPFLPVAGAALVVITSTRRVVSSLGVPVEAGVFSEPEALAYLAERTGIRDPALAGAVAEELGWLPLALAQAAAVIATQRLSYRVYLDRLRALPISRYLTRSAGDPYPRAAAAAILLSLQAAHDSDDTAMTTQIMDILALLSPGGVPRDLVHQAAADGRALAGIASAAMADAALAHLADGSVLTFSADGSTVSSHGLIMRVIREQHANDGTLADVAARVVTLLHTAMDSAEPAWQHAEVARNLIHQLDTLTSHVGGMAAGEELLELRGQALLWMGELGDNLPAAIRLAEALIPDCEQSLGGDHRQTLRARGNLASFYREADRLEAAIILGEQVVADLERVAGADDAEALAARANLAWAYRMAHRVADAIDLAAHTVATCEEVHGSHHIVTLMARNTLADAYNDKGQLLKAVTLYEGVLDDSARFLPAGHPSIHLVRNNLALAYVEVGRMDKAVELHTQILAEREQSFGPDNPRTLASRHNLACAYDQAGRVPEAIALLKSTIADRARVLGPDHRHTLLSRSFLGGTYLDAGRVDQAISVLERTAGDCERVLGPDDVDTLNTRKNLADAYAQAGRFDEAIATHEAVAGELARVLGRDHPRTLSTWANLATIYLQAGRGESAIALFKRTLKAQNRLLGASHPRTLYTRGCLGAAYLEAGQVAKALALLKRAAADSERILGRGNPDTLAWRSRLAVANLRDGRPDEAIAQLKELVRDHEESLGPDHLSTMVSRGALAAACLKTGRLAAAAAGFERALADCEHVLGAMHRETLACRGNLAHAYLRIGRLGDAMRLAKQALADAQRILTPGDPAIPELRTIVAAAYRKAGLHGEADAQLEQAARARQQR